MVGIDEITNMTAEQTHYGDEIQKNLQGAKLKP